MIELTDPPPAMLDRHSFDAANGCTVTVVSMGGAEEFDASPVGQPTLSWPYEGESARVGVRVTVGTGPPELSDCRLLVPEQPRQRAEAAIDEYADMLAVAHQCRRTTRSPMAASVAMASATDAERSAIEGVAELTASHQPYSQARVLPVLAPQDLQRLLDDRPDAVQLMADAQSESTATARAREFFRLFERAFKKAGTRLIDPLAEFLSSNPRHDALGYERDEVRHWLTTLRAETVHGDRRAKFARPDDVRPHLGRLEVAAYDVVLNKAHWRRSDSARRSGQSLLSGVQIDRHSIVLLKPEARVRVTWRDQFGVYPIDRVARVSLGPEWIWAGPDQRDGFDRDRVLEAGWDLH